MIICGLWFELLSEVSDMAHEPFVCYDIPDVSCQPIKNQLTKISPNSNVLWVFA